MGLLARGDPEFILEQSRWFDYRMSAEVSDFALDVESVSRLESGEAVATMRMSYLIGPEREPREVRFAQRYRKVGDAWLDADLDLLSRESDHFVLRYQAGANEASITRILENAESAWYSVRRAYGQDPAPKTTLKAFVDRELLRQNTKITIGRLFNGWAEPGESIKLWIRPDTAYKYTAVIAHEMVHALTLAIASNQCSWFAEGLANHFGSFAAMGGDYLSSGYHEPADYDKPVAWLAELDSQTIDDDETWFLYGGMAGTVVRFMAERYGRDTPQAVVRALAAYPQARGGYVYALHDAAWREDLAGAIITATGVDMDRFEADWRAWIRSR